MSYSTEGISDELHRRLHFCDICIKVATNPVATPCGHFFCRSCLTEAFRGEQARPCPVCRVDIQEETAHVVPTNCNRVAASANRTREPAIWEMPVPKAPTPVNAGPSLISTVRMDVVLDQLEEKTDHVHNFQLTLSRHLSDLLGERVQDLEQVVENLLHMNVSLLRELGESERERRRMSRRLAELENPTIRGANELAMGQQRVGVGIHTTPIDAANANAGETGARSVSHDE